MNDCVLHNLWEDIVVLHWNFIKTEEGLEKTKQRKCMEDLLNEFLSNVPHERKFFLPQTADVLQESITNMSDFSAYKAMTAFESISNYADNLATKPWRKEYRTIKMYSGYYQHEIKANLLHAEKMFEAMGYKILPNHTMIFEGVICPDQVVNVSRDAMVAVAECEIMSQIYRNLRELKVQFNWLDIFNFRQYKSCGVADAVDNLQWIKDNAMKSADYANWKNGEEFYSNSNGMVTKPCKQLSASQHLVMPTYRNHDQNLCQNHSCYQPMPQSNDTYNYGGGQFYNSNGHNRCQRQLQLDIEQRQQIQQNTEHLMIHSKSLDHHNKHGDGNVMISPQRHSFDMPHDKMDARKRNFSQKTSGVYAEPAYDRSYHNNCNTNNLRCDYDFNFSGNRLPLPHEISQQISNQYPCNDLPSTSASGDCNKMIYRPDQQLNEIPNDYRDSRNIEYDKKCMFISNENDGYAKSGYVCQSLDGTNDLVSVGSKTNHLNIKPFNQEKSKNNDGVGSYGNWKNVYEQLETSKPTPKPSCMRDADHSANCLALNSIEINVPYTNTIDKRRQSRNSDQKLCEKYKAHTERSTSTIEDNYSHRTSVLKNQPIYSNQTTNSSHNATKSSLKSNGTILSNNNFDNYSQLDRKLTKTLNINECSCICSYSNPIKNIRCEKCTKSFINKPTSV